MTPDSELLRQYAEHGDQAAFAEVVRRQVDLVYSAALRVLNGNVHLAEDVTQSVFTQLARHAREVGHHPTLVGWLHTTARNMAIKAIRGEQRRRVREQEASAMQTIESRDEVNWEQLRPFLDEAVDQLGEEDRHVVLLRYFQNLSHRDVGAVLGLSEDAARKRSNRAVDQLRAHFARRGVAVSAARLAEVVGANSVQAAPATLAARISGKSLAGAAGAAVGLSEIFFMNTKSILVLASVSIVGVLALMMFRSASPAGILPPAKIAQPVLAPKEPAGVPAKIAASLAPPTPAKARPSSTTTVAQTSELVVNQVDLAEAKLFVTQRIVTALLQYKLAMGHYPSTADGMQALINCPPDEPAASWRGPYVKAIQVPLDPWGHPYEFAFPSIHGQSNGEYDVWSDGPDGISGTADDIGNWMPSP